MIEERIKQEGKDLILIIQTTLEFGVDTNNINFIKQQERFAKKHFETFFNLLKEKANGSDREEKEEA